MVLLSVAYECMSGFSWLVLCLACYYESVQLKYVFSDRWLIVYVFYYYILFQQLDRKDIYQAICILDTKLDQNPVLKCTSYNAKGLSVLLVNGKSLVRPVFSY